MTFARAILRIHLLYFHALNLSHLFQLRCFLVPVIKHLNALMFLQKLVRASEHASDLSLPNQKPIVNSPLKAEQLAWTLHVLTNYKFFGYFFGYPIFRVKVVELDRNFYYILFFHLIKDEFF